MNLTYFLLISQIVVPFSFEITNLYYSKKIAINILKEKKKYEFIPNQCINGKKANNDIENNTDLVAKPIMNNSKKFYIITSALKNIIDAINIFLMSPSGNG